MFPLLLAIVVVVSWVSAQEFQPLKPNQVPCIRFDDCGVCGGDNAPRLRRRAARHGDAHG
jgi:hypothetical protein